MRRTRSTDRSPSLKHRTLTLNLQLVPERSAHPRQQLLHAEGFSDIVVGAEIERGHLAGLVVPAR